MVKINCHKGSKKLFFKINITREIFWTFRKILKLIWPIRFLEFHILIFWRIYEFY